jgi:glycosyltransferase involved in cell wall biosynthesis
MRLLIDAVPIGSPGIIALRDELARSVEECTPEDSDVVLLIPPGPSKITGSRKLQIVTVEKPGGGWLGRWKWYHSLLPRIGRDHSAEVIYSLSGILSKRLCESFGTVTTVNNMLPFTPERLSQYPFFSKARLQYALLLRIYVASTRMAHAVVLHSRHAQDTITSYTGDISSKTFVALTGAPRDLGINNLYPPPHPNGKLPYFMYLSATHPHKNHLELIEAYRRAYALEKHLPDLLFAGFLEDRSHLEKILAAIKDFGLEQKVKYIGVLNREDIPAWLYHARANIFPSTCETNSVILAEILGLGGVLACSGIPPMSEVAGYAAEFFDPYSAHSMKDVLIDLYRNQARRNELRRLALKRGEELSWSACGEAIWKASMKAKSDFQSGKVR